MCSLSIELCKHHSEAEIRHLKSTTVTCSRNLPVNSDERTLLAQGLNPFFVQHTGSGWKTSANVLKRGLQISRGIGCSATTFSVDT